MKRSERAKWLRSVGLTSGLACQLAKLTSCECGEPAVAIGVFCNLAGVDKEEVKNAMWLCAEHAGMADEDVEIYVMREQGDEAEAAEGRPCAPAGQKRKGE